MKTMMHIIFVFLLLIIFSCSNEKSKDEKLNELELLEKQQRDINKKIRLLKASLNTEVRQNLPLVRLNEMKMTDFVKRLNVNGYVEAIKQASLSPETRGKLQTVYVKEGEMVKKGDLLAKLNTGVIDNTIDEVRSNLSLAVTVFEKQSRLWEKEIGSEVQYLEAKTKKESLEKKLKSLSSQRDLHDIRASFDGVVDRIYSKEGEVLSPGIPFAELVQLDQVYAVVDVSEKYISKIKKNDKVEILFPSLGIDKKEGSVLRTSHVINKKNRTFRVEVLLQNTRHELKPNMMTIISFEEVRLKDAVKVANKAVQKDMRGYFIYKVEQTEKGDKVLKQYVKTGLSNNIYTLIENGVKPGEKVIIDGYNQVSDGSFVDIVKE